MEFYFSVLEGTQEAEHNSPKDKVSGKQGSMFLSLYHAHCNVPKLEVVTQNYL